MMAETKIGEVFQYFAKPGVAAVKLTDGPLKVGDRIHVLGHTTDFTQRVDSMQVDRDPIDEAAQGGSIGVKVQDRVRPHDTVYRIED